MKLKMNKACDLNSISVLPPHNRRTSMMMAQQPRSQPSQQSFSQGFSQLSQNSFDEAFTDNQKFGSQDKDIPVKRASCLPPYPREDSQMPISMSSNNLTRRWSSAPAPAPAPMPDQKPYQLSSELEHKVGTMETLLSRFGMILDSVQADIMHVNKGTKELSLTVEGIRQKSIAHDDFLHLLNRVQEETKTTLEGGLKAINNQLSNTTTQQEKMQETLSTFMTSLDQIQAIVREQTKELSNCLSGDLQAIISDLKTLSQKHPPLPPPLPILAPKVTGGGSSLQKPLFKREHEPLKMLKQQHLDQTTQLGGWKIVKPEGSVLSTQYGKSRNLKQRRFSPPARPQKVIVNLDPESDEDFSCFVVEKGFDNHLVDEVNQEAELILRKARMRSRKQSRRRF